jgi:TetR/AcrR family fatty acid metabolism transcriptional regulator
MSKLGRDTATARAAIGDKRESILRAAIKVFAGRGYFSSKVSDIAREAGIADGTVYLYFKSKDEILHSIFDRAMEEFIAEGRRELAVIASPGEKLKRIAELHLEKLGADRDLAVVDKVYA